MFHSDRKFFDHKHVEIVENSITPLGTESPFASAAFSSECNREKKLCVPSNDKYIDVTADELEQITIMIAEFLQEKLTDLSKKYRNNIIPLKELIKTLNICEDACKRHSEKTYQVYKHIWQLVIYNAPFDYLHYTIIWLYNATTKNNPK